VGGNEGQGGKSFSSKKKVLRLELWEGEDKETKESPEASSSWGKKNWTNVYLRLKRKKEKLQIFAALKTFLRGNRRGLRVAAECN